MLIPAKPLLDRKPSATWLEQLRRWLRRTSILDSPDFRIVRSEAGIQLFLKADG